MTDVLTKEQRSYNMSQIKGKNTQPELLLRKYLFLKGLKGYRLKSSLIGKPDIVFTKYKIAIFIDGCFWHKCPGCFVKPTSNINFWKKKIDGNVKRDKEVNKILKKQGWKVIRFWEHEIKKDLQKCYSKVEKEINKKS
ncbi:MAG: very short patch repair endonuclease [Candidatus Altiarchaeota archaeon]|nr:very short patch repair endonuclease [Candidatus Altiarchaeota archaeon]